MDRRFFQRPRMHSNETSPEMRHIRVLENRLDKVMIKYNEATGAIFFRRVMSVVVVDNSACFSWEDGKMLLSVEWDVW